MLVDATFLSHVQRAPLLALAVLAAQLKFRELLDATEQALAIRVDTSHPVDWVALLPTMD